MVTASRARAAWEATGVFPGVDKLAGEPIQTEFGLYAKDAYGSIGVDGDVKLTHSATPVWAIIIRGVMALPLAGPHPRPGQSDPAPVETLTQIVALVDATSGAPIATFSFPQS